MSHNTKSQSALEYLMTDGWAILVIVIVAGVLYSLGIFSPSSALSATVTGFAGLGNVGAVCMSNGALGISIGNSQGNLINVTEINATNQDGLTSNTNFTSAIIYSGGYANLFLKKICSGSSNSIAVSVEYYEPGQIFPGPYLSLGKIITSGSSYHINSSYYLKSAGPQTGSFTPPYATSAFDFNLSEVTISAWVYNTGPGDYWQNVVELFNSTYPSFLDIGITGYDGACVIRWQTTSLIQPGSGNVLPNEWNLITGTWNSGTNNLTVYLNGRQVASSSGVGISNAEIKTINIAGGYGGMYTLLGQVSDVQIYNVSLTPSQVTALYNEGLSGVPITKNNIIGWWPLDGNPLDYYGNNNLQLGSLSFT